MTREGVWGGGAFGEVLPQTLNYNVQRITSNAVSLYVVCFAQMSVYLSLKKKKKKKQDTTIRAGSVHTTRKIYELHSNKFYASSQNNFIK
jgi:hypothetical protein